MTDPEDKRKFNRTLIWVLGGFLAASITACLVLAIEGAAPSGTTDALRVTGRVSFLLFWPAYVGGLLRKLRFPPLRTLAGLRREFGLSFAAAHTVHVALIVWLFHVAQHAPVPIKTTVIDGIGLVWVYVLAAFSTSWLHRALSPAAWRILFNIGLEYIALIFLSDLVVLPLKQGNAFSIMYIPFAIMLLAGAAGRWSAALNEILRRFLSGTRQGAGHGAV